MAVSNLNHFSRHISRARLVRTRQADTKLSAPTLAPWLVKLTEKYEESCQLRANTRAAVGDLHNVKLTSKLYCFHVVELLFGIIKEWLNTLFGVFINKYLLAVKSQQEPSTYKGDIIMLYICCSRFTLHKK